MMLKPYLTYCLPPCRGPVLPFTSREVPLQVVVEERSLQQVVDQVRGQEHEREDEHQQLQVAPLPVYTTHTVQLPNQYWC